MKATFKLPYIYLSRVHSVQIPPFKNILPFLLTIPVSESLIPQIYWHILESQYLFWEAISCIVNPLKRLTDVHTSLSHVFVW